MRCRGAFTFVLAIVASACGSGQVGALSQADLPAALGLTTNSGAASLLGGASKKLGPCDGQQVVFTPPGKRGLPFEGAGEAIPYTELDAAVTTCPTERDARFIYAYVTSVWTGYEVQMLTGIGDNAELANASDTGEYPESRTFLVAVRVGDRVGTIGLEAPSTTAAVSHQLMVTLARRVAVNLSAA